MVRRHLKPTPPPARCHIDGVPLERRLNKPHTTAYPNRSPTPPLRRTRLARMERRLPKTVHYDHDTVLPSCVTTSATAASEPLAHALGTQAPTVNGHTGVPS
ncbi:hypothetical protein WOLCODRAFT_157989 [Wolfiporia cocos MD-104 SS10]|uniref:Uncharacterized protein n=1 Tax=Wolfiporia cocos (strain MD-104) TaxID=742152 RepID=A0A2H3JKV3_WOLCO|nr:hypothetical protein WOLCODRAFT_157989 [Wolfiporia cocos MD-104 SS10]